MHRFQEARVAKVLDKIKEIEVAFLFGSAGRETTRPESDVDIALLLNHLPAPMKRVSLRLNISESLSKVFGREVDVTILNTAGSLLKYQVAKDGKVLFERRKGLAKEFKLRAIKEYFDYLPTLNFHYERLRRQARG